VSNPKIVPHGELADYECHTYIKNRLMGHRHMTIRLSNNDYDLLEELKTESQTITGAKPRDGADRLVAAAYATSRNLNVSSVEYEITELGRLAVVLKQFGVRSTQFSVEPHRHEVSGIWHLKITSEGNPTVLMDIGGAAKLSIVLRTVGADDMANDFERQIDKARRYAGV
jgi:hypothetical protein